MSIRVRKLDDPGSDDMYRDLGGARRFFGTEESLVQVLTEIKDEFENSNPKAFGIRKIAEYDEISYEIVGRYIRTLNLWIKDTSFNHAEVITKCTRKAITEFTRDMFSDSDKEEVKWKDVWCIYVVWTGSLPCT